MKDDRLYVERVRNIVQSELPLLKSAVTEMLGS